MQKKCSRGPLLVMKPNLLTQEAVPKALQADGKYNAVAEKLSCYSKGNQCNSTQLEGAFAKAPLHSQDTGSGSATCKLLAPPGEK